MAGNKEIKSGIENNKRCHAQVGQPSNSFLRNLRLLPAFCGTDLIEAQANN